MRNNWLPIVLLATAGCGVKRTDQSFSQLAGEFVYTTLSFSPVSATAAGYHKHQGIDLDQQLDDLTPAAFDRQRKFYEGFRYRLSEAARSRQLSPEDQADYDIIRDQIELALLELDEMQSYRHNPTLYVELIGYALFHPLVVAYAPKPQRFRHIIARAEKIPALLEQARKNLMDAPEIWIKVAAEENEGNMNLIDNTIRAAMTDDLSGDYERAAKAALDALRAFQDFLKNDLSQRTGSDWRLGYQKYSRKFRYTLATDWSPEQVLEAAEADLKLARARMFEIALSLDARMYGAHPSHADLGSQERENRIISETLARIASRHATPETYIPEAKRDLEEARRFIRARNLLTLPARSNLQVIETPEFMRGAYAVGGFAGAPALEPQLGAFYWVTPIPTSWPPQRIQSKLREYNFYKLKLLTIHEAMPGHYVQFEFANDIQPQTRRVLRSVVGNGPYIEGWGQYAEQIVLDEGFLDNSPELRLTFQKEKLRVLANAILDIRLHTRGMTDQEALDLMENQTFQEHEEATAKLQRAKLTSCQLPTYFAGWRDWLRVREHYRQWTGAAYRLQAFNDSALKEGPVPLPALARLLTGKALGERRSK